MNRHVFIKIIFIFADIDDCASQPCKNNGTCGDKVNDYVCRCQEGFTGKQCETSLYFYQISYYLLFVMRIMAPFTFSVISRRCLHLVGFYVLQCCHSGMQCPSRGRDI